MAISKGASVSFTGESLNLYLPSIAKSIQDIPLRMKVSVSGDEVHLRYYRQTEGRGSTIVETPGATLDYRVVMRGKHLAEVASKLAPFKLVWTEEFEVYPNSADDHPLIEVHLSRAELRPSNGPKRYSGRKPRGEAFHSVDGTADPHVELGRCLKQLNAILASGRVDDVTIVVNRDNGSYNDYPTPSEIKITGRRAVTLGE